MQTISIAEANKEDLVSLLQKGQTLVYPTETCYGLGCDATNEAAVNAVFAIKKRQADKPVLVIMADVEMAMAYVEWSPMLQELADKYWPGPLTVVAPLKEGAELASGTIAKDGTLAFRVTGHEFVHDLCEALGKPLVSTSANIASQESPYDIESIYSMFDGAASVPDLIIDNGSLPHESPSTIVKIVDGKCDVLRQGALFIDVQS